MRAAVSRCSTMLESKNCGRSGSAAHGPPEQLALTTSGARMLTLQSLLSNASSRRDTVPFSSGGTAMERPVFLTTMGRE